PRSDPASVATVGFAGIGRMGLAMARNLLRAGFPLAVWNRTADRCTPLVDEGATAAAGPTALAVASIVVTMVSDGAAARAVLDAMTKGHVLLGPSGAGAAMKLAVNSMIAVANESIAETLTLAQRFGIDPELAYDVLAGGVLASPFLLYKRGAFLHPGTEPIAFTTAL